MKIFFDTNVLVADALLGGAAMRMLDATEQARWRIFTSRFVLDELARVLLEDFQFSRRLAALAQARIIRRSGIIEPLSAAQVPHDPNDTPILQAALTCGADYLVTNDRHLFGLNPFEGLRIISMNDYFRMLQDQGMLQ